jgi:hypothetical protein
MNYSGREPSVSAFVASFGRQAEQLLAEHQRVQHNWTESNGGWVHLERCPTARSGSSSTRTSGHSTPLCSQDAPSVANIRSLVRARS